MFSFGTLSVHACCLGMGHYKSDEGENKKNPYKQKYSEKKAYSRSLTEKKYMQANLSSGASEQESNLAS